MENAGIAVIRKFEERDADNVRDICAEADDSFSPGQRGVLLTLYCNYYIEQEPESCLVLADENDDAVGYCIAASDWVLYKARFSKVYLPVLRRRGGILHVLRKKSETRLLDSFAESYPAHLHIDLREGWRGSGYGTKLLAEMAELLAVGGVKGIMLGVGAENTGAQRFYERFGYSVIGKAYNCIYYGYSIS